MFERFKQLYRNGGWWGLVRAVIVVGVVLTAAVATPFARPDYWPVAIGGPLGLVLPYFFRKPIVEQLESVVKVHRFAGIGILIAIILLREQIKQAGPVTLATCVGLLGVYISSYFWLMSDPQVYVRRDHP